MNSQVLVPATIRLVYIYEEVRWIPQSVEMLVSREFIVPAGDRSTIPRSPCQQPSHYSDCAVSLQSLKFFDNQLVCVLENYVVTDIIHENGSRAQYEQKIPVICDIVYGNKGKAKPPRVPVRSSQYVALCRGACSIPPFRL